MELKILKLAFLWKVVVTTIARQNVQNNKEVNYQTSPISFKNMISKQRKKRKVLTFCYTLKRVLSKWPVVPYTQLL